MPSLRPISRGSPSTAIVVSVASNGSSLIVDVKLNGLKSTTSRIEFHGLVGYRVLDERDLPLNWGSGKSEETNEGCLLYEVMSDGWAEETKAQSSIMAAGFYPKLREWLVVSDDWCVSVLSDWDDEPLVTES